MNGVFSLSSAQLEILEACRANPENTAFNMACFLDVRGCVERGSIDAALRRTVSEAAGLRARFSTVDDVPKQQVSLTDDWEFPLIDLSSETCPRTSAHAWMQRRRQRPYDLALGPLFDFALLRMAVDQWIVYLGYHQLVLDVFGIDLLVRRCAEIYEAVIAGTVAGPSPFGYFGDYLAEEAAYQGSSDFDRALKYFSTHYTGGPAPVRLVEGPGEAVHEIIRRPVELLAGPDRLQLAVGPARTRWLGILISVLAVYVARMRNVDDVSIGVAFHGRTTPLSRTVPTRAANVLPVRLHIPSTATWEDLGTEVRDAINQLDTHQRYRGEDIPREAVLQDRRRSFGPVVHVLPGSVSVDIGRCHAAVRHLETAPVDDLALCCQIAEDGGGIITLEAHPGHYEPSVLDGHRDRIAKLLAAAAAGPGRTVREADLLTDRDTEYLLREWNDTAVPLPELTVPEMFEKQVAETPDAIALEIGHDTISYAELSSRSSDLARRLADIGIEPENSVGILMERSADLVVALLGVAKTGAAYVPLDPRYPVSRMRSILSSVGSRVLLVDRTTQDHEVTSGQRLLLANPADAGDAPGQRPLPGPTPDASALLYIMHTSGSTGEPKGVQVTHRNVIALALDRSWRGAAHTRVLFHSPHAFDASTYELWVPLLSGGRVVISPQAVDAVLLRRLIGAGKVTAIFLTSGLFSALAEGDPACLDGVREVWTGGEVVSPGAVDSIAGACQRITVFNVYGPTENTAFATRYRIPMGPRSERELPIGIPMDNTRVYVLDEQLRLVPPGAVGCMYIAGEGVARGYAGRPDLTAESFLPDLFGAPGDRMYATGDLARWETDGNLSFLGRADDQVKIHGFRIEPGEIESVLAEHPSVSHAAVMVSKSDNGDGHIIAYAELADPGAAADDNMLRDHLAEQLPEYMLPSEIVGVCEMPYNRNGKVDRPRLSELRLATATEQSLADLWAELLEVPVTSGDASFWELGGDSLLGYTLVARIRERLGVKLRLRELFQHPHLGDLAGFIDAAADAKSTETVPDAVSTELASNFQRRIWLAEKLEPAPGLYNIPLAWRVSGRLDPERLALAVARVIERHEVLRTTFAEQQGALRQVIGQPWRPVVRGDRCGSDAELTELLRAEADRPFDLATGPLLRAGVIESQDAQILTVTVHHIVFDASSLALFMGELQRYYEDTAATAIAPRQYRDLVEARERTDPAGLDRRVRQLRGAPSRLPAAAPSQPEPHGLVPLDLPGDLLQRMRPLQDEHGMSWFMVTAAALAGLLHRWTGSDDVTFGFGADARSERQFAGVIGPCLNMVVLRSRCGPSTTAAELLVAIRDGALEALEDQDVPFGAIVDALNPARSAGSTPYLDVVLAPQARSSVPADIGGCDITPLPLPAGAGAIGKFAVTVSLEVTGARLTGALLYRGDRVSAETATGLARLFARMIEGVLDQQDQVIGMLDLAGPGDELLLNAQVPAVPRGEIDQGPAEPGRPARQRHPEPQGRPARELEQRVAAIWSSLLDVEHVGADDNFFDRGGNSLKLVTLHAELCREFEMELPIQRLFDNSTVRTMARFLEESRETAKDVSASDLDLENRGAARRAGLLRRAGRQ